MSCEDPPGPEDLEITIAAYDAEIARLLDMANVLIYRLETCISEMATASGAWQRLALMRRGRKLERQLDGIKDQVTILQAEREDARSWRDAMTQHYRDS